MSDGPHHPLQETPQRRNRDPSLHIGACVCQPHKPAESQRHVTSEKWWRVQQGTFGAGLPNMIVAAGVQPASTGRTDGHRAPGRSLTSYLRIKKDCGGGSLARAPKERRAARAGHVNSASGLHASRGDGAPRGGSQPLVCSGRLSLATNWYNFFVLEQPTELITLFADRGHSFF